MLESGKRLFVGVKISSELQNELNNPAPGTEHYFKSENTEYLQIITLGDEKLIGRYIKDAFPATDIENVMRNVCSILRLITRGHRMDESSVRIYAS